MPNRSIKSADNSTIQAYGNFGIRCRLPKCNRPTDHRNLVRCESKVRAYASTFGSRSEHTASCHWLPRCTGTENIIPGSRFHSAFRVFPVPVKPVGLKGARKRLSTDRLPLTEIMIRISGHYKRVEGPLSSATSNAAAHAENNAAVAGVGRGPPVGNRGDPESSVRLYRVFWRRFALILPSLQRGPLVPQRPAGYLPWKSVTERL